VDGRVVASFKEPFGSGRVSLRTVRKSRPGGRPRLLAGGRPPGVKGELPEQTFEERFVLRVFAPAEITDGRLAALYRLGTVADDLLELLVGAPVLVVADGLKQVVLEVVVAL
jgi:hypothetical protein